MQTPAEAVDLAVVFRNTVGIYILLIAGFRFIGRRQLGQLTVVDLVIIIIMGSAVETAMVNGNTSLPAGLVSASALLITNRIIAFACMRSRRFRHFVSGGPVLLVHYGQVIEEHLKRTGLTDADIRQALRSRGFARIEDVKFAILEEDGAINAVGKDTPTLTTPESTLASQSSLLSNGDKSVDLRI